MGDPYYEPTIVVHDIMVYMLLPLVDCNINCHKDCKDSVVVECHRRDKRGE